MTRERGDHLERDETKKAILEFLLSNDKEKGEKGIRESEIRKYLESKYEISDEGNIRTHLKELLIDNGKPCLEKFEPKKRGQANHWDITKIEHLKNIRSKFPDLQLNKYEKSLKIVLKKNSYDILTYEGIEFQVRLLLSSSFFNACIDTNIEILFDRTKQIFVLNYPLLMQEMEDTLNDCYILYVTSYRNLELSFESFKSMIMQMTQRKEISGVSPRILKEKSLTEQKPFAERFMKVWEKELLGLAEEKSNEMHQETMGIDLKIYWSLNLATSQIEEFNLFYESNRYYLLFMHYVQQDILDGIASEDEIRYAIQERTILESFKRLSNSF